MQTPTTQNQPLTPASIISDLNSADPKTKMKAIKNLPMLCAAIGQDRVKKELIPYLISIYIYLNSNRLR